MELAFFVPNAFAVAIVTREPAACEDRVGLLTREPENDERGGRRGWVSAEPFGVGCADRLGKSVGTAENFDRSVLAVVGGGDAKVCLLVGRQRIADCGDGFDELVPAKLLAQIAVVVEGEVAQRAAEDAMGSDDGADIGAANSETGEEDSGNDRGERAWAAKPAIVRRLQRPWR